MTVPNPIECDTKNLYHEDDFSACLRLIIDRYGVYNHIIFFSVCLLWSENRSKKNLTTCANIPRACTCERRRNEFTRFRWFSTSPPHSPHGRRRRLGLISNIVSLVEYPEFLRNRRRVPQGSQNPPTNVFIFVVEISTRQTTVYTACLYRL